MIFMFFYLKINVFNIYDFYDAPTLVVCIIVIEKRWLSGPTTLVRSRLVVTTLCCRIVTAIRLQL